MSLKTTDMYRQFCDYDSFSSNSSSTPWMGDLPTARSLPTQDAQGRGKLTYIHEFRTRYPRALYNRRML